VDDRRIISGIIFVIRNGLHWRGAPAASGIDVRGAAQAPAVLPLRHIERISAAAFDTAPAGQFRNWLVVHRLMKLDHLSEAAFPRNFG